MSESAEYEFQTLAAYKTARQLIDGGAALLLEGGPIRIVMERYSPQRSTEAGNLYWLWMGHMAKHFSRKGNKFDKDDMHDLMRHQFLGYETKTIGRTQLSPQLRSTKKGEITTAEMCEYMQKVDAWAADHGCLLPRPEDNDYAVWQKAAA